ncbi:molybdopterin-binding protein [Parasulfitobacter algicola]|uniref:Molybdopterin-binding protein n=1 Tax=Parasulfitobacter algicola TaxID=2614809 RepID=A0ABX2IWT1_9RHOB|nr:molybdopterin-binding protein [Sulfitobacter algicola]NSX55615.1 molybdopterin-binding protein [Sulfitobacter algicola]
MEFGAVSLNSALGAILAHSMALPDGRLRKGLILQQEHIIKLEQAGFTKVTVARLAPDDVSENDAALQLAQALVPDPDAVHLELSDSFTGRVNIKSTTTGVVILDIDKINTLNRTHPMITLATATQYAPTRAGRMVGTVKIISYGVQKTVLEQACRNVSGAIEVVPTKIKSVSLIVSQISGSKGDDKGIKSVRGRLNALDIELTEVLKVDHTEAAIAQALTQTTGQLKLILTASATSDSMDVAPQAVRLSGGTISRFGMPVDPGNLLFLGDISGSPVIGLPGCARSPALNGADWVLERVACGIPVTADDIAAMGVGGLLKEIPSRPQPRDKAPKR